MLATTIQPNSRIRRAASSPSSCLPLRWLPKRIRPRSRSSTRRLKPPASRQPHRDLAAVDAREAANEAATTAEVNTFYLLWAGALIFLMQAGFAVLGRLDPHEERQEHPAQEPLDACMGARNLQPDATNQSRAKLTRAPRALRAGAVGWYTLGYGFAYQSDDNPNPFIGGGPARLSGEDDTSGTSPTATATSWWFQYALPPPPRPSSPAPWPSAARCARRRLPARAPPRAR